MSVPIELKSNSPFDLGWAQQTRLKGSLRILKERRQKFLRLGRIEIGIFPPKLVENDESLARRADENHPKKLELYKYLSKINVNKSAQTLFRFSYDTSSKWHYYPLYRGGWGVADKKITERTCRLFIYLSERYGGGVGAQMKDWSNRKALKRRIKVAAGSHPMDLLDEKIKKMLRKMRRDIILGQRKMRRIKFRTIWRSQLSGDLVLQRLLNKELKLKHSTDQIIASMWKKRKDLSKEANLVVLGYCLIRGLYGISFDNEEQASRTGQNRREFQRFAGFAGKWLSERRAGNEAHEFTDYSNLTEALTIAQKRSCKAPPLKDEGLKAFEQGTPIFKRFRLNAYMKILRQLEESD